MNEPRMAHHKLSKRPDLDAVNTFDLKIAQNRGSVHRVRWRERRLSVTHCSFFLRPLRVRSVEGRISPTPQKPLKGGSGQVNKKGKAALEPPDVTSACAEEICLMHSLHRPAKPLHMLHSAQHHSVRSIGQRSTQVTEVTQHGEIRYVKTVTEHNALILISWCQENQISCHTTKNKKTVH